MWRREFSGINWEPAKRRGFSNLVPRATLWHIHSCRFTFSFHFVLDQLQTQSIPFVRQLLRPLSVLIRHFKSGQDYVRLGELRRVSVPIAGSDEGASTPSRTSPSPRRLPPPSRARPLSAHGYVLSRCGHVPGYGHQHHGLEEHVAGKPNHMLESCTVNWVDLRRTKRSRASELVEFPTRPSGERWSGNMETLISCLTSMFCDRHVSTCKVVIPDTHLDSMNRWNEPLTMIGFVDSRQRIGMLFKCLLVLVTNTSKSFVG